MTTNDQTPKKAEPKARVLLRFGLDTTPMKIAKLRAIIEIAEPSPDATIRVYNGSAIIEEPPSPEVEAG